MVAEGAIAVVVLPAAAMFLGGGSSSGGCGGLAVLEVGHVPVCCGVGVGGGGGTGGKAPSQQMCSPGGGWGSPGARGEKQQVGV